MSWALFTFIVYIMVLWWASAPGKGYAVQRLLATRTERDAKLAFLWYAFLHYVLRPWPWIIVGILSFIYFPTVEDTEHVFPLMIDHFLPTGLKGIMVAAMLAAFMSTIDTHLKLGSFVSSSMMSTNRMSNPNASPNHYVWIARICRWCLSWQQRLSQRHSFPDISERIQVHWCLFRRHWYGDDCKMVLVAGECASRTCFRSSQLLCLGLLVLIFLARTLEVDGESIDRFGLRILSDDICCCMQSGFRVAIHDFTEQPSEAAIAFHITR